MNTLFVLLLFFSQIFHCSIYLIQTKFRFMVKPSFILFLSFLIAPFACKQPHSKSAEEFKNFSSVSIHELTKLIAHDNVLTSDAVGIAGSRPAQWERYEQLSARATAEELVTLTSDNNAVVRCYAFQALAQRKTEDLFPIVLQHLSDTETVRTMYGCIIGSQTVGDFFLETINGDDGNSRLTMGQKKTVDSLLLFDKNNQLQARNVMLSELQPLAQYYQRLRQLSVEEQNKLAVMVLAKYRKPQDKPLIEKLLAEPADQTLGLAAVVNFPDASFYPVLQQLMLKQIKKDTDNNDKRVELLYQAIVRYKTPASKQLLQTALASVKGMQLAYHSDYLYQALKIYPDSMYNGLLKKS